MPAVDEVTFAASSARGRPVLYVTERAVFRLRDAGGLELVEVAPGVDPAADVLARLPFAPAVASPLGVMDGRCFEG